MRRIYLLHKQMDLWALGSSCSSQQRIKIQPRSKKELNPPRATEKGFGMSGVEGHHQCSKRVNNDWQKRKRKTCKQYK